MSSKAMGTILLKIRRREHPGDIPFWEEFAVDAAPGMTVLDALREIQRNPAAADGTSTAPVAFDACCGEGACGACAMIVNGRARLACRTFLDDEDQPIVLEALSAFPVVRDLRVDRSRIPEALARAEAWVAIDGLHGHGGELRIDPADAARAQLFSSCILCGICAEVCPQVNERSPFPGAFPFALVEPLAGHPVGRLGAAARLDALAGPGGVAGCMGAQSCEAACPQRIPLTEAIARLGGGLTRHALRRLRSFV